MNRSERLRRGLVAELEKLGMLKTEAVRRAFLDVPREHFLPSYAASDGLKAVYANDAIVTKKDADGNAVSSSSQPSIMAVMLDALHLEPGHRVLEIGAGTGYNAALLKRIVGASGRVVAVDIDRHTAREARANLRRSGSRVRVAAADGCRGFPGGAPFDRMIVTASVRDVPRAWHRQLAKDGLLELPFVLSELSCLHQVVATFEKDGNGWRSISVVPGGFMSLRSSADATGAFAPVVAVETRGEGAARMIAAVAGDVFVGLDDEGRRRIVSLVIGELRRTSLPGAVNNGLPLYVALGGPPGRSIMWGWGVAGRDGKSIAFVRPRNRGAALHSAGRAWAEDRLRRLVERWRALGSPNVEDLRIRITYGGKPPRAWRTVRRGNSFVAFDWSIASKRT